VLPPDLPLPTPAAQHFAPVTFHGTMDPLQCPYVPSNAVVRPPQRPYRQRVGPTESHSVTTATLSSKALSASRLGGKGKSRDLQLNQKLKKNATNGCECNRT
jgi:hypothetical protein